jgi:hypothetical protein
MNCIHQTANANNSVSAFVSFMQLVQVKQQVESAIRTMCSVYPTALQHLQDARLLDIFCISSKSTIISMHDAGYPLKVQQPVRKMLL